MCDVAGRIATALQCGLGLPSVKCDPRTSIPIPKFATPCDTLDANFAIETLAVEADSVQNKLVLFLLSGSLNTFVIARAGT
jgi:hypothetical protein